MGTFAEIAIVDYHLSFADQEKHKYVFHFRLQQSNASLPFPFSVTAKNGSYHFPLVPFPVCRILETWRHGHGDMDET
jgi:hypothetical protein